MASSLLARLAVLVSLPVAAAACVVETTDSGPRGSSSAGGAAGGPSSSGGTSSDNGSNGSTGDGSPSAHPILAQIDTNQTMTVSPGQGVGVFTEYVAGGHWHVWWTCDSDVNPQSTPCAFDVKISVAAGSFTNVKPENFETKDTFTSSATQIEGVTTTTTAFDGALFDTAPGATITLEATVGGRHDGQFLFFVQNGKVNGGYGAVTDPLQLVPSSP
jgi:hypothetical protein